MATRFVPCTSAEQALELFEAGLLWVNQSSRQPRHGQWEPAYSRWNHIPKEIAYAFEHRKCADEGWYMEDFAYVEED